MNRINYFYFISVLFICFFSACSELAVDTQTSGSEEEVSQDTISGDYHLEGNQITIDVCWIGGSDCDWGEELGRDTLQISFTVQIDLVEEKEDTLLFTSLEGANSGQWKALHEDCGTFPNDCAYANLSNSDIEFDIHRQPGKYFGTGSLIDDSLELNTTFSHRGIRIEYELTGSKTEESL